MKKYSFAKISEINEAVFQGVSADNLDYFEYNHIPKNKKISFMLNRIKKLAENEKNITFSVIKNDKVVSIWSIAKNDFDSDIFGIESYRIANLLILEPNQEKWNNIIEESLKYLKQVIAERKKPSYLTIGLNTNAANTPFILNKLIKEGFYYIHSLITFKMLREEYPSLNLPNNNTLQIRTAKPSDVDDVMALAKKSFKYSRFHLDPFLDKKKANTLLAVSAKNSILHGFADIMFVAEIDHRVVGYDSAKKKFIPEFNLTFGEVITTAVDENYRGLGIFKQLNKNLLGWFAENTDVAEMGTYIANTPVHKTWCNNGLNMIRGTHQLAVLIAP